MASHTALCAGDGTKTGWTGVGDTSNLYANVDTTDTPVDATYNYSATTAANTPIYFLLSDMPGDFSVATAVTIYIRIKKDTGKIAKAFDKVWLVQSDETTAITAQSPVTTTTTITTVNYSPSITGGTSKAVWDEARLALSTTAIYGSVYIYAAKVVITYTAVSGRIHRVSALNGIGGVGQKQFNPVLRQRIWTPPQKAIYIPAFSMAN